MSGKLRIIIFMLLASILSFGGWRSYLYFFDSAIPTFTLEGIKEEGCYAGDISCTIHGQDRYKVAAVSLLLDGKTLARRHRVGKRKFNHTFELPAHTMADGPHELEVKVHDGTFSGHTASKTYHFVTDNKPMQASFISQADTRVFQGRTLHVQFQVNKQVKKAVISAFSQEYACFPESRNARVYEAFIPIACEEQPNEYLLSLQIEDCVGNDVRLENKFQVVAFPFKKCHIKLNQQKVEHEHEVGRPQREFEDEMQRVSDESPKIKMWRGRFFAPVTIKAVTTPFGEIRTSQQKGLYVHKAVDVVDAPRSVVWAPQDGIVVIKDRFAQTGNTVVIDHGWGITSSLCHFEEFADINIGDKVKRGNPLGTLGKTGYATGYHLHWECRVNNVQVDPLQWTKAAFW
jgi:murein DD-endopeptidase MepM/ murein hydrolase activator NlpD